MHRIASFLALSLVLSCSSPTDAPKTPSSVFGGISEPALSSDYAPFTGSFVGRGIGCTVKARFEGNAAYSTCITANAIVYFTYTFVLDKGTITTYVGECPIIWWFECKQYPYEWDGGGLKITDPVNNRILILEKE